jgi:hypothetical protein
VDLPDWLVVYDLAAQWGGYPWNIDLDRLSAQDVERSRLYANYQARLQIRAAKAHGTPPQRKTLSG